jgi:DNA-binding NarL/FixJ family response regulator
MMITVPSTHATPRTLLIVDDDVLLARDMQRALEHAGYRVLTPALGEEEALAILGDTKPDLCLVDIDLGAPRDGVDLAREIVERHRVPVMFVSAHSDGKTLSRAIGASPHAFVVKPFSDRQLLTSIELAFSHTKESQRLDATRKALEKIANTLNDAGVLPEQTHSTPSLTERPELSSLSDREREVLRELLANRRVPSIARTLGISPSTVRNHLKSIFHKVGVHSQEELIELMLRSRAQA